MKKEKLESILNKGKIFALAGIASLAIGCASMKHYIEPKLGFRGPVSEKQALDPSLLIGVAYGFTIPEFGLGVEAGLDYFRSLKEYTDPVSATIETNSFIPKVSVNFSPLNLFLKPKPIINPYVMTGMSVLGEVSIIDIPDFDVHDEVSNAMFGLDLGFGATLFNRIDASLNYTGMPASENAGGMLTFQSGYRFIFGEKIFDTSD